MKSNLLPILYSLHNCPYAIRARLALLKAHQKVLIRSIKLDNKPTEMLLASAKGSVPVLVLPQGLVRDSDIAEEALVIEESLDIMIWALSQHDPDNLQRSDNPDLLPAMLAVIQEFERNFIPALNAFACAKRYHETNIPELRKACEAELIKIEERLTLHSFIFSEQESLVDIALVPFLRKYARIDKPWFRRSPYPKLQSWLNGYLRSSLFSKTMKHYDLWLDSGKDEYFA